MTTRALAAAVLGALGALGSALSGAGCASAREPSVSGVGLFDSRNVGVGDVVEIRLPAGADGRRAWKVSSFDSAMLAPEGRPSLERQGDALVYVLRFRAKVQGETDVSVRSQDYAGGTAGEEKTFRVRIW